MAIDQNNLEIVKLLLEKDYIDVNYKGVLKSNEIIQF